MKDLKAYPKYKDSGVPWLGDIPEHWNVKPGLSAFSQNKVKNAGEVENTVLSLSYGSIVVKPQDKLHGLVPESFETYQIVNPGNLIIRGTDLQNDRTSLRVGISRNRGIITSAYMCLVTNGKLTSDYGYQLLHAYDTLKIFYGMGSGLRQNLDYKDIKRLPVIIPPAEDQQLIVEYIKNLNQRVHRFIRSKRKLIQLLNEQKQVIIHQAVTRGLDPNVRLKLSGVDWLGDVPEYWEVRRLRTLSHFITSGSRGWAKYYADDGPTFIRIGNISTDNIDLKLTKRTHVKPPKGSEGERTKLVAHDILLSITAQMGAVGIVPEYLGEAYVNQHTALIRITKESVPRWVAYSLISMFGKNQYQIMMNGGTKVGLTLSDVKNVVIPFPPQKEQALISKAIDLELAQVNIFISRVEREIDLIREYRTRLISDVVTGKIDVRDVSLPEMGEDNVLEDMEAEADEFEEVEDLEEVESAD